MPDLLDTAAQAARLAGAAIGTPSPVTAREVLNDAKKVDARADERLNWIEDLFSGEQGYSGATTAPSSLPFTLSESNNYTPLTLNRILLSYSYMTQGLVQTVIKQPVEDAFRGRFKIISQELDDVEKADLMAVMFARREVELGQDHPIRHMMLAMGMAGVDLDDSDIDSAKDTQTWARLYGGAGMIINTDQKLSETFNPDRLTEDSPLQFIAADRWELILSQINIWDMRNPTPFNYYGLPLNRTRVMKVMGEKAPSYIRQRLQGWGMSEIERCIRAINAFVKFENVIFQLMDEAKIDVFKITGMNSAAMSSNGLQLLKRRLCMVQAQKSYNNAVSMDAEDDYAQKQIAFSGLAELWGELRLNLSSALKIPMNKLFGQSATGFGGGEDSIENYNSIVQSIREKSTPSIMEIARLRAQQMFGYQPRIGIEWPPLKILNGTDEQTVLTAKQDRAVELFTTGLTDGQETSEILAAENLLPIKTAVLEGTREAVSPQMEADAEMAEMNAKAKAKPAPAKKK
jgi:phage-related protein (TIGR01555 family)